MKFYELDLSQIVPYGVPINSDSHVEYTRYINEFFLKGFEKYFSRLFTVDEGTLIHDYARSCAAPTSLEACNFCTNSQLQSLIMDAGFVYYSANTHEINAKFLYNLGKYPFGTTGYLTTIAQYISNSDNVFAEPIYENHSPYTYGIRFHGDIAGSINVAVITARMIENLSIVGTAHTQISDFEFNDTDTELNAYVAGVFADVSINYEAVEIPIPEPVAKTAYLRSGQYQSSNKNLTASSQNILYGPGESVGLSADVNKIYTLTGAFNKDGLSIAYGDAHLYTTKVSSDPDTYQLRLMWDSNSSANICYVEYTEL